MITHKAVWQTIDKLAREMGLSPSSLAIMCNLDSTTFNQSKRFSAQGKPRWPSLQTVAKIVEHTKIGAQKFFKYVEENDKK